MIFKTTWILSRRFKNSGKYVIRSKLSLGLIYGLSFWFQASYFRQSWVQKTGLLFYLVDFHGRNWRIPGFYENNTQHRALLSTKTNQGRFYFYRALILSWAYDLAAVNQVTQAVFRAEVKKLRPEPKFLNHGLC